MDELECNRMAMIPETINYQRFEVVNQNISVTVKFKLNSDPMNRRPWDLRGSLDLSAMSIFNCVDLL